MSLDKLQLQQFLDNLIGFRTIGIAQDEEVQEPVSPEMRNFIVARLGALTPSGGYYGLNDSNQRMAIASLLREVADSLEAFMP